MCTFTFNYYLLTRLLTKAQNTVSSYITTENVLVRYDSYLPKASFSLQQLFLFPEAAVQRCS